MLKWKTEEKTKENDKPRVVLNKGLGGRGGKEAKHLSNCRKPFVRISYTSTPFEKKPRIAGKNPELQGKRRLLS